MSSKQKQNKVGGSALRYLPPSLLSPHPFEPGDHVVGQLSYYRYKLSQNLRFSKIFERNSKFVFTEFLNYMDARLPCLTVQD